MHLTSVGFYKYLEKLKNKKNYVFKLQMKP